MKRNRKRQVTAMAMAVMMAAASFNVSGIAMPVYAAEQSDEIHFPDVYAKDLVQPIKDQETINECPSENDDNGRKIHLPWRKRNR